MKGPEKRGGEMHGENDEKKGGACETKRRKCGTKN